jgi:hypothetical protein
LNQEVDCGGGGGAACSGTGAEVGSPAGVVLVKKGKSNPPVIFRRLFVFRLTIYILYYDKKLKFNVFM